MGPAPPVQAEAGIRRIRVLLVEESSSDEVNLDSVLDQVQESGVILERVDSLNQALERLSQGGIDLLMLDLDLPDGGDIGTFERAHAFAPDVPIIVLTRVEDQDMALSLVKAGAQDYLVKGETPPHVLVRAIQYATERKRLQQALEQSEARYRHLIRALPAAVFTCDSRGYITLFNERATEFWGRRPEVAPDDRRGAGGCVAGASGVGCGASRAGAG